jgi:hypothetical protein
MRRHEAILLLARIVNSCKSINIEYISLEHPSPKTSSDSEGYELHIKCCIDDQAFNTLKRIVTAHNLGFKEYEAERLVIYIPKRNLNSIGIVA